MLGQLYFCSKLCISLYSRLDHSTFHLQICFLTTASLFCTISIIYLCCPHYLKTSTLPPSRGLLSKPAVIFRQKSNTSAKSTQQRISAETREKQHAQYFERLSAGILSLRRARAPQGPLPLNPPVGACLIPPSTEQILKEFFFFN